MSIKFKKLENGFEVKKSHDIDSGLDIYMPESFTIKPFETLCLGLGLCVEVPVGYAGMLVPRSSIAKKGLIIQTSIIDPGYTGEIHLIITNCSNNVYKFQRQDRVCSIVIYKTLCENIKYVEELNKSERGANGLGSTGK